jgi:hypothetical protein
MASYETITLPDNSTVIIMINSDGVRWAVPTDLSNSDYQAYLVWKAAQPTAPQA